MISIITPSYGQLDWLRLAVASVTDQEEVDFEHIIQDGGTARIEEVLHSEFGGLLEDKKRLKLFVEKDAGMYDAVNRGLAKAHGEVCAYLNCDEQYLAGTLSRISSFFAARPKIDIVFGDVLVTDRAGNALSYRRAIRPSANHIRLSHLNTFSCATFFRRRVLEAGHWFDPKRKSIGDAVWIHAMLKAGLRVAVYPQLLSVFTLTGSNVSTDDPVSEKEKQAWLAENDAPLPVFRPWHIVIHRLQKLIAGAYRRRTFDYEIYTLESPAQRVRLTARKLGGRWKTK
jgi:glycosyltransferase involved in cell wall biosynthesis